MLDQIINILLNIFSVVINWMTRIFDAVPGSLKFILTFFTMGLIIRFVLGPILGIAFDAGISDKVKGVMKPKKSGTKKGK